MGFCVVAALSKYINGFPYTSRDNIGKSPLIFSVSNIILYFYRHTPHPAHLDNSPRKRFSTNCLNLSFNASKRIFSLHR